MSRANQWRKIFGHTEKQKVRVGAKLEELTDTQAYRFEELTHANAGDSKTANGNPLEQSRYSLDEAAFRLMISEEDVLQRAVSGAIALFTGVAGFTGRWRRVASNGSAVESSVLTLRSGYLALTVGACRELIRHGATSVSILEFPNLSDPATAELDDETLTVLSAWGKQKKSFCVSEPQRVDRSRIVLLAPLVAPS